MDGYLKTNNSLILEGILRKEFSDTGLTLKELARIANGEATSKDHISAAIKGCQQTVKGYDALKGALCKGELKAVGSVILNVPEWKFEQFVLDRKIKAGEYTSFKYLLAKDDMNSSRLSLLIQQLDEPRILAYKDTLRYNQLTWFTNMRRALSYVKDFLTEPDTEAISIKGVVNGTVKTQNHHNTTHVPSDTQLIAEDKVMTPKEFIIKYRLDTESYLQHSPIVKSEIELAMGRAGLSDMTDITLLIRSIVRNPRLEDIIKIPRTEFYSKEKVQTLAEFYADALPIDREQFWIDADLALGVKRP